jgi:hypothetical protein
MSLPDQLPHLCAIYKSAPLQDEILGDLDDSLLVTASLACWFQPASDREITRFQRRDQEVTHKAFFKGNPGVRPGYVLIPTDGPTIDCPFAGATMEVMSANETTAGLGLLWAVMCREVQPR